MRFIASFSDLATATAWLAGLIGLGYCGYIASPASGGHVVHAWQGQRQRGC